MYAHLRLAPFVRAATLACAAALAPLAIAADATPPRDILLSGMPPAPEVQQENGVEYLTGGVGIDGRAQLAPLVKDMNLQLVFAEKQTGAYLAAVEVLIADNQGKEVLKLGDADPMLFADLEPGTYSITAKTAKGTLERQIEVPSSGQRTELFLWS